jgi:hypothetical protein
MGGGEDPPYSPLVRTNYILRTGCMEYISEESNGSRKIFFNTTMILYFKEREGRKHATGSR